MARASLTLGFAALSLAPLLSGCTRASPTGVSFDREIREPSGLVASSAREGVWWTHGDSASGNWIFAVNANGQLLARVRVQGTHNADWEDITRDDAGHLWIGDIGNNDSDRRDLRVYRVPEPDIGEGASSVRAELALDFYYPEQHTFGDQNANFDAESLFWWDAQLWLLTKHRSNDLTYLYRFPSLEPSPEGSPLALERIASFDLGPHLSGERKPWTGQVTAADVSPDGRQLAMLSYDAVFIFALPPAGQPERLFDELLVRIDFDQARTRQVEALAWKGEDLLMVNEERAVFAIDDPLQRERYP